MAQRASDQPLDEIQWRSPALAQQMQGIHSNSGRTTLCLFRMIADLLKVLPYFANSPFFDPTSNNAVLMNQAMYNQNMLHIVATREAFEGRLKSMAGLEYIVAQEPAETAPGTGTGVWVIRKQTRRKRPGQEDEIAVHATYFVMGENIYMAPAVGDVIGSRLVKPTVTSAGAGAEYFSFRYSCLSTSSSQQALLFQISHPLSVIHICPLPEPTA
jgi:mediator of RNA polymerase II transcription subunit 6